MLKKEKIALVVLISLLVGVLSFLILRTKYKPKQAILLSIIPLGVLLTVGIVLVLKKSKENFLSGADGNDPNGCSQTINIYQNCGGKGPSPQPPSDITPDQIKKWMLSVNSKLTAQCQECVSQNAIKLWSQDTLAKVQSMPKDQQLSILNAMLVFDCQKQCIIPASQLDKDTVVKFINSLAIDIPDKCKDCAVAAIMKLWAYNDLITVTNLPTENKKNVIMALLAVNCPSCETSGSLPKNEIEKWLTNVLSGAKPECYSCVVDKILAMWDQVQYAKVLAMDKKSQAQIVQALIAINCQKECIEIPSGINIDEVKGWLASIISGESAECILCAASAIVKLWTPAVLSEVKGKSSIEQVGIVQALISLNCPSACYGGKLNEASVYTWVKQLFPSADDSCIKCIVSKGISMWNKKDFGELLSKSSKEQAKIIKLLADFNCPHACTLGPIEECTYMP